MFDMVGHLSAPTHAALVMRAPALGSEQFLVLDSRGKAVWTTDPTTATPFPSMREATRAAFRLPADLRAFSILKTPKVLH